MSQDLVTNFHQNTYENWEFIYLLYMARVDEELRILWRVQRSKKFSDPWLRTIKLYKSDYFLSHSTTVKWLFYTVIISRAQILHWPTWFAVDGTLQPRGGWISQLISKVAIKCGNGSIWFKTHTLRFIWVHLETNASCCLFQTMWQRFGFGRCIYEKR